MNTGKWSSEGNEDRCPRCNKVTEYLFVPVDENPEHDSMEAERCRPCGWKVVFNEETEHEVYE